MNWSSQWAAVGTGDVKYLSGEYLSGAPEGIRAEIGTLGDVWSSPLIVTLEDKEKTPNVGWEKPQGIALKGNYGVCVGGNRRKSCQIN